MDYLIMQCKTPIYCIPVTALKV